jgi:hypothetical protein
MLSLSFLRKVLDAKDKTKPVSITTAFKQHIAKQHKSDHGIIVSAESVSVKPVRVTKIKFGHEKNHRFVLDMDPRTTFADDEYYAIDSLLRLAFVGAKMTVVIGDGCRKINPSGKTWMEMEEEDCSEKSMSVIDLSQDSEDSDVVEDTECNLVFSSPPVSFPCLWKIPAVFRNEQKMCVLGSFANLMKILHCYCEYNALLDAAKEGEMQSTFDNCKRIVRGFGNFEMKEVACDNLTYDHWSEIYDTIGQCSVPFVVSLRGYGYERNHCVAVFRNQIIDCLDDKSFPFEKRNLDYSLGQCEVFMGISRLVAFHPKTSVVNRYVQLALSEVGEMEDRYIFVPQDYHSLQSKRSTRSRKRRRSND